MNAGPNSLLDSSNLTTEIAVAVVAAAALSFPVSFFLLSLYRRAVLKGMAKVSGSDPADAPIRSPAPRPRPALRVAIVEEGAFSKPGAAAEAILARALGRPWRIASAYALGGLLFALCLALATLWADGLEVLPVRLAMLVWIYFWPAVLTANLVAASTMARRAGVALLYLVVLGALAVAAFAHTVAVAPWVPLKPLQLVTPWLIFALIPTLLLVLFLNRRIRAVGPLVLSFMVVAFAGLMAAPHAAAASSLGLWIVSWYASLVGLTAQVVFILILLSGLAVAGVAGWLVIGWLGRAYEAKRVSDQSVTVDSIWLFFAVIGSVLPATGSGQPLWLLSGVVSFVAYKAGSWLGFRLISPVAASRSSSLLLLRVFALGRRSQKLLDVLATGWRHVGCVQLISGPDLATSTVEPHEFLTFLTGRISHLFIDSLASLGRRLGEMDARPDPDGRYRVNELFCRENAWQGAVRELVERSDVVLMDVRSFSASHPGVTFELQEVVHAAPFRRLVLVIDGSTDLPLLKQVLHDAWEHVGLDSPNLSDPAPELHLYRMASSVPNPRSLFGWVGQAAASARGAGGITTKASGAL